MLEGNHPLWCHMFGLHTAPEDIKKNGTAVVAYKTVEDVEAEGGK